jgi:hypothetical protein
LCFFCSTSICFQWHIQTCCCCYPWWYRHLCKPVADVRADVPTCSPDAGTPSENLQLWLWSPPLGSDPQEKAVALVFLDISTLSLRLDLVSSIIVF